MKVKELIEELQKCPQDYEVFDYDGYSIAVDGVRIYDNEKEIWI